MYVHAQSWGGGDLAEPPACWPTVERAAVPGAQALVAGAEQVCLWWLQAHGCYSPVLVSDTYNG